jgi:predicted MFS family arabinose efflux permease
MAPTIRPVDVGQQRGVTYLWRIIIGYGLFGFGYVVSATFIVAMATALEPAAFATGSDPKLTWLVVGATMVPSVYFWQWLANRFGTIEALQLAYLVEAVGVVVTVTAAELPVLLFGGALLGGTFAAITALGLSAARQHSSDQVAFAVSGMTVAFALGQLLGPAFAGRMADNLGDFVVASFVAAALLVSAALLLYKQKAS